MQINVYTCMYVYVTYMTHELHCTEKWSFLRGTKSQRYSYTCKRNIHTKKMRDLVMLNCSINNYKKPTL